MSEDIAVTQLLAEPDRPGEWKWRLTEMDEWAVVLVGLISGGGALRCHWPPMADYDDRPWQGQWLLHKQAGPSMGRSPKLLKNEKGYMVLSRRNLMGMLQSIDLNRKTEEMTMDDCVILEFPLERDSSGLLQAGILSVRSERPTVLVGRKIIFWDGDE